LPLRCPASILRYAPVTLTLLGLLPLACVSAPPSAVREVLPASGSLKAEKGASFEGELGPGESREFALPLQPGWYVSWRIQRKEPDFSVRLVGPRGEEIAAAESLEAAGRAFALSAVTDGAGEYRLRLALNTPPAPQAARGWYRIEIQDLRPAQPADGGRIAAERAMSQAFALRGEAQLQGFQRALDLWRRAGDAEGEVDTLVQIGVYYRQKAEKPREAISWYEKAVARADEAAYRWGKAQALQSLGVAASQLGEWDKALTAYSGALAVWTGLGDLENEGRTLYSLGNFYQTRGDSQQALHYFAQALPLRQGAGDLSGEVNTLNAMAMAYSDLGRIREARESFERLLELSQGAQDTQRAGALSSLAGFDQRTGELQKAQELYQKALQIFERLGVRSLQAQVLNNMAALSHDLGDLETALDQYRQALDLCRSVEDRNLAIETLEAQTLANLGWTQHLLYPEQSKEALQTLDQAYELGRNLDNSDSTQALALYYIGRVHSQLNEPAIALPFLERSSSLWQKNPGEHPKSLLALGEVHQALGHRQEAARFFSEAVEASRRMEKTSMISKGLYLQAAFDRANGDLEKALGEIEEALGLVEGMRSRVESDDLRTSFFASRRAFFELYIEILMRLHEQRPGDGFDARSFQASERARARGLLDLLAEGRIDVRQGIAPDLKRRETELDAQLGYLKNQLSQVYSLPGNEARIAQLKRQIGEAGTERERLSEQIRHDYPQYAALLYPKPLDLAAVQGLLDDRTALCEYAVGEESSFLFVVTRDRLQSYRLPGQEELGRAVQTIRRALAEGPGRRRSGGYVRAAFELYQQILAPAESLLRGKSRLLVSPDGPLLVLPFDALLTGNATSDGYDLPYLLRRYAITSIPSASVLGRVQAAKPEAEEAAKTFLGYSDPIYETGLAAGGAPESEEDGRRGVPADPERPTQRLEESAREVREIASLFPAAEREVYERGAATEENIENNELLKKARLIHFATHGFVDEVRPYLSGLVLTRTQNSEVDGILRMHEIFNLKMRADVVVLSACNTGLGKQVSGEGLVGLTRAFLYAGANSMVVSLWQVADHSTADLMVDFYNFLKEGAEKVEALQRAKLRMIESGGKTSHPFYWAPFVLTGEPGALSRNIFPATAPVTE
jgi:CHAT domain-containing protein/Tfp pilus assembly protein PilF